MISSKRFNISLEINGIFLLVIAGLYLVLYALEVYDIDLPVNHSTYRAYIFCIIFFAAVLMLLFRPRIDQVDVLIIFYFFVVVVGQYANGLLTFSKAGNDLFFPIILFAFRRYFYNMNERRIKKIVTCECLFNVLFFTLFMYAFFSMRLGHGMFLNSSYYCALLLPFILCIEKPNLRNMMALMCLIPSILSLKRGAYLSVILGILIFYIAIRKTEEFRENKKKYIWWVLGTVLGVVIIMVIMSWRYHINMIDRLLAASDDGGSGRIELARGMIGLLQNNDVKGLVIGHGSFTSSKYLDSSSHNDFLEMLWSYGLLGFLPYIFIVFSFFKTCKKLKSQGSKFYAPALACLVEFLICSLVSQLVFVPTYVAFLLIFFAFAEAQSRQCYSQIQEVG